MTLNACEKFSVTTEAQWSHISSMCEARAFASYVTFNAQYIYVFGGMHDYAILQSVEKYDTISDTWNVMYFKLPRPLAKLGSCLIGDTGILIAGGMSKDFEPTAEVWELSLTTLAWTQKPSMRAPRLASSGLIFTQDFNDNSFVLAIGGNQTKDCERFDCEAQTWELMPSFRDKLAQDANVAENHLFTYSTCASSFL